MEKVVTKAKLLLTPHIDLLKTRMEWFEDRVDLVQRTLSLGQNGYHSGKCFIAGVYGKSGVGKTTLALAVYDRAAFEYGLRRTYFTVGPCGESDHDLRIMRRELIGKLTDVSHLSSAGHLHDERQKLRTALGSSGPLLLVLDDLRTRDQLYWLLACDDSEQPQEAVDNLPAGSRVLLTSRDQPVVTISSHNNSLIGLEELQDSLSEQLLCLNAFSSYSHPPSFTSSQLKQSLRMCGGLPWALQLLGRQLRHQGQSGESWQVHLSKGNTSVLYPSDFPDPLEDASRLADMVELIGLKPCIA